MLSVILPVYNAQDRIHTTLRHILSSNSRFELIIINDGSTDSTEFSIRPFLEDDRVIYIFQSNRGLAGARHTGLLHATGQHIVFCDDDDIINIDVVHEILVKNGLNDLIVSTFKIHNDSNLCESNFERYTIDEYISTLVLGPNVYGSYVWNKIYKREIIYKIIDKISVVPSNGEDLIFNIEYNKHISSIYFNRIAYYTYFVRDNSISRTISKASIDNYNNVLSYILQNKYAGRLDVFIASQKYKAYSNRLSVYSPVVVLKNILKKVNIKCKLVIFLFRGFAKLNCFYSLFKNINILDSKNTIAQILNGKSISRFGDGELRLLFSCGDIGFQRTDVKLANELREIASSVHNNVLVCLPNFHNADYKLLSRIVLSGIYSIFDKHEINTIFKSNVYGDSFVTRPYIDFIKPRNFMFDFWISFFYKKKILIINGYDNGLENSELLINSSLTVLKVPNIGAYDVVEYIYQAASDILFKSKYNLALLSCGPTATVLSFRLSNLVQTLDIGHLDIEYLWFKSNVKTKVKMVGTTCGEV